MRTYHFGALGNQFSGFSEEIVRRGDDFLLSLVQELNLPTRGIDPDCVGRHPRAMTRRLRDGLVRFLLSRVVSSTAKLVSVQNEAFLIARICRNGILSLGLSESFLYQYGEAITQQINRILQRGNGSVFFKDASNFNE